MLEESAAGVDSSSEQPKEGLKAILRRSSLYSDVVDRIPPPLDPHWRKHLIEDLTTTPDPSPGAATTKYASRRQVSDWTVWTETMHARSVAHTFGKTNLRADVVQVLAQNDQGAHLPHAFSVTGPESDLSDAETDDDRLGCRTYVQELLRLPGLEPLTPEGVFCSKQKRAAVVDKMQGCRDPIDWR